jgi:hypothetical protein
VSRSLRLKSWLKSFIYASLDVIGGRSSMPIGTALAGLTPSGTALDPRSGRGLQARPRPSAIAL